MSNSPCLDGNVDGQQLKPSDWLNQLFRTVEIRVLSNRGGSTLDIDLVACVTEGEDIHIATLDTNGFLDVSMVCKNQTTAALTKTILWRKTDYGQLRSLAFNRIGTQLAAVTDLYLIILPLSVQKLGDGNEVVDVPIPKSAGEVTCCTWWQTAVNRDIIIIATKTGNIIFLDPEKQKCSHKTQVKSHVIRLEVIPDDRQHITYLLISGKSNLQWKLLLDICDLDEHKIKTQQEMAYLGYMYYGGNAYVRSILHSKTQSSEDFQPQRFVDMPISVTMRYQNAKGCHLLSAMDKRCNSLKIYDSTAAHHPLYVYNLPYYTNWVLYTDHLIYCTKDFGSITVLANQLSEMKSNQSSDTEFDETDLNVVYRESLMADERIHFLCSLLHPTSWYTDLCTTSSRSKFPASSHTLLDGCLVITSKRILLIRPNLSPEHLFILWCMGEVSPRKLELLARVTHIDIHQLYVQSANYHLQQGQLQQAKQCLTNSKCEDAVKLSLFYQHKQYREVIAIGDQVLASSAGAGNATSQQKSEISDYILHSYISLIESGDDSLIQQFSQFLMLNSYYSLETCSKKLCAAGLISLLLDVALVRKFIFRALEHVLEEGKLISSLLSDYLDNKHMVAVLDSLSSQKLADIFEPLHLADYLLNTRELRLRLFPVMLKHLDNLPADVILKLAQQYHPHSVSLQTSLKSSRRKHSGSLHHSGFSSHEEDSGDDDTQTLESTCAQVYLFFTELVYKLHTLQNHQCLKIEQVIYSLPDGHKTSSKSDEQNSHSLVLEPRPKPIACSSNQVYFKSKNGLFTWGSRLRFDQLRPEERVQAATPHLVTFAKVNTLNITAVSCGEKHILVLSDEGLFGWGDSTYGQVGNGIITETVTKPTRIKLDCVDVNCGRYHNLALTKQGRLYSWGWGLFGQLGHNSIENESRPRFVSSLAGVCIVSASAGHSHSMALTSEGQLYVFGSNLFGQLEVGWSDKVLLPSPVNFSSPVRAIATRYFHSVAVLDSNQLMLWGVHPFVLKKKQNSANKKYGGDVLCGMDIPALCRRRRRIAVPDERVVQVECGASHILVLTEKGVVYSWEEKDSLIHLDDGRDNSPLIEYCHMVDIECIAPTNRCQSECSTPTTVFVSCENGFSLALRYDGSLVAWGRNDHSQLGLGGLLNNRVITDPWLVSIPAEHIEPTTIADYALSYSHSEGGPDACDHKMAAEPDELDCSGFVFGHLATFPDFPIQLAQRLALDSQLYVPVVLFYCGLRIWNEACFYHLKSLASCVNHMTDYTQQVLKTVQFYMGKVIGEASPDMTERLTTMMFRVFQFWHAKSLPVSPDLEDLLHDHLELLSPILSQLLLRPIKSKSLPQSFTDRFSRQFLINVTRNTIGSTSSKEQIPQNPITTQDIIPNISMTSTELKSLLNDGLSSKQTVDIIVFTCKHRFTQAGFLSSLSAFENGLNSKLPLSTRILLDKYHQNDFTGVPCPTCMIESIANLAQAKGISIEFN